MATGSTKKTTTAGRSSAGNRQSTGRRTDSAGRAGNSRRTAGSGKRSGTAAQSPPLDQGLRNEIIALVLLAATIFLLLCNFGLMGPVSRPVSDVMFGLFGLPAYITPLFLFGLTVFGLSNKGSRIAGRKIAAGVVLYLLLGVICDLIVAGDTADRLYNIGEIYKRCADNHNGGGIIAASLAYLGYHNLGLMGTVLIILVLGIISAVIITERSFMTSVKSGGRKVYERSREDAAMRRERNRQRKEEWAEEQQRLKEEAENDKILRMDKKISGVMTDITLVKENKQPEKIRDDMHEITLHDFEEQLSGQLDFDRITIHGIQTVTENDGTDGDDRPDDITEAVGGEIDRPSARRQETGHPAASRREQSHPAAGRSGAEGQESSRAGRLVKANPPAETGPGDMVRPVMKISAKYILPPISKLRAASVKGKGDQTRELKETAARLQQILKTFGVLVTITEISQGPAVTRYELQPEQGVKVSKIVSLTDDIKLNLAATDIRIEAPIPGKAAIGIEVPNKENSAVAFRDLVESKDFKDFPSDIAFAVGKDIGGKIVVFDIARMPHMLIAGATGSGKSVCINTLIMSILYKAHPDDVKLIMIDPKVVELSVYNGIPHLLIPVVTDPKKASAALHWGVAEMTDRYQKFADLNVRDLKGYNKKVAEMYGGAPDAPAQLPQIVIIVDELADLMMVAPGEVEESICRLAQLARAAGIHLIIATQRPSVDVITGLIKANMPSRVAFSVSSGVDSRTILDMNGAEKLLGKGDMLFYPQGYTKPARVQGAFISDKEVSDVVDFIKNQTLGNIYSDDVEEKIMNIGTSGGGQAGETGTERDQYFVDAARFIIDKDKASIGNLQRVFKIGFNRAARIMDQLCDAGVVGEEEGTKPRKVLMSLEEFERYIEECL